MQESLTSKKNNIINSTSSKNMKNISEQNENQKNTNKIKHAFL